MFTPVSVRRRQTVLPDTYLPVSSASCYESSRDGSAVLQCHSLQSIIFPGCCCLPTSRSFFIIAAAMQKPVQALMNGIPRAADESCNLTHRVVN